MTAQTHPMTLARELALQTLFQFEFSPDTPVHDSIAYFAKNLKLSVEPQKFAEQLVSGTFEYQEKVDSLISGATEHWSIERMATVDVSLLRLAAFEMVFFKQTPPNVVINEYVELAKKYSSQESSSFVNGLLDKIKADHIE